MTFPSTVRAHNILYGQLIVGADTVGTGCCDSSATNTVCRHISRFVHCGNVSIGAGPRQVLVTRVLGCHCCLNHMAVTDGQNALCIIERDTLYGSCDNNMSHTGQDNTLRSGFVGGCFPSCRLGCLCKSCNDICFSIANCRYKAGRINGYNGFIARLVRNSNACCIFWGRFCIQLSSCIISIRTQLQFFGNRNTFGRNLNGYCTDTGQLSNTNCDISRASPNGGNQTHFVNSCDLFITRCPNQFEFFYCLSNCICFCLVFSSIVNFHLERLAFLHCFRFRQPHRSDIHSARNQTYSHRNSEKQRKQLLFHFHHWLIPLSLMSS